MLSPDRQTLYAECDIPEGVTLREWRYRKARPPRGRRLHLPLLSGAIRARRPH